MKKVLKGQGHDFCHNLFCCFECTNKAFKMINRNNCQLLSFMQDSSLWHNLRLCNVKQGLCNDFVYIH